LRDDAPRLGHDVRRDDGAPGRGRVHHGRDEGELRPADPGLDGPGPGGGPARPCRRAGRDRGRPSRGCGRPPLRPRDVDVSTVSASGMREPMDRGDGVVVAPRERRRRTVRALLFVAPAALALVVLFGYPLAHVASLSVRSAFPGPFTYTLA